MKKLTYTELQNKLKTLDGWRLKGTVISKDYKFSDFAQAFDFMNQLAVVADKELNHHPDWSNSYNKVSIKLTSHDSGGLTSKDIKLAKAANKIAKTIIA